MPSPHTLAETEQQVAQKLGGLTIDFEAMAVASNLFRAANATRNYLERTVLAPHGLSWTAFVVLWVTWIWEPIETRQIAEEGGFSKATLTGVLGTLEGKGLLQRERSTSDGRLVLVSMTQEGCDVMQRLFPEFNRHEQQVAHAAGDQAEQLAELLRRITADIESRR
ncbi:tyrZ transcriptional regulator YwaE [Microcella alkalica]|uniref:DNA-binding MarR family transcriptional regulator n=1 Tax=Microcella alkalica TaxID=355930 RepID=A0A839E987_9MICO|nr:MarR family transcriptional regulator [Microcella alkalica]MBA8847816.1 DNA-binding MarR family transcriptional regulator [Microcella alkalica]